MDFEIDYPSTEEGMECLYYNVAYVRALVVWEEIRKLNFDEEKFQLLEQIVEELDVENS